TRASLPYSDGFNQADGSALSRDWVDRAGAFKAQGNRAAGQAALNVVTLNTLPEVDVVAQANVSLPATGVVYAGVAARCSGPAAGNMSLAGVVGGTGGSTAEIWRNLGGTWTRLGVAGAGSGTGLLTFRVQGNRLVLTYGATTLRALDGAITGAGLV